MVKVSQRRANSQKGEEGNLVEGLAHSFRSVGPGV